MGDLLTVRSYDQDAYRLGERVAASQFTTDLTLLHLYSPAPEPGARDQDSYAHTCFYKAFDTEIRAAYEAFVVAEILPLHGCDLVVQKVPTFRVARPGGLAVSQWHTDAEYAHQAETVNYWVPLTPACGTSAVWTESRPGAGDYQPVNLMPGEYLEFSATRLRHGNKPNQTGRTRVSFDFRVLRLDSYRDSGASTVSHGVRLRLGDYYALLCADGTWGQS